MKNKLHSRGFIPMALSMCGLALSFMTACQKTDFAEVKLQSDEEASAGIISRKQAEEFALKAVALMSESETKSVSRTVKGSSVVRNIATKSESGSDTLLYVVNFESDGGYAIIAADKKTEPLVAVSDEGNFDWELAENSDAHFVTEMLVDYQINAIASRNLPIVTQPGILNPPPFNAPNYYERSPWYVDRERGKKYMVQTTWHQKPPYSTYTVEDYPTGCTITAVAQIMAYHKYPKNHDGFTFVWSDILVSEEKDTESVRRFVQMVFEHMPGKSLFNFGSKKVVAVYLRYVPECLSRLGYVGTGDYRGIDVNEMAKSIFSGYPVCVQGNAPGDLTNSHTWIMDGILYTYQEVNGYKNLFDGGRMLVSTSTNSMRYFHCNWGWGGDCDGYFAEGVFDADKKAYENGALAPQKSGSSNDFRANLMMVTFIKP